MTINNEFSFDEKQHLYKLGDKNLTGVTTILSVIGNKTNILIQWSANMAVDYVKEKAKWNDPFMGQKEYEEVLEEARKAHRKKKEAAGDVGTAVHSAVELWITKKEEPKLDEQGMKMFNNFKNWAIRNQVKFLESELRMYSEDLWIAGTADFICEIGGKKYIGDLKTGGVYDRLPMAQCAAYRMMYGAEKLEGTVVVNIKKDGSFNEIKDVYYSMDYQTDLNIFLSALTIYRALATFKN